MMMMMMILQPNIFDIVIRFARISYRQFIAIRYKFKLSTYVQEWLVRGRRGCEQRDLNEEMVSSR